jgi:hypothetical protein
LTPDFRLPIEHFPRAKQPANIGALKAWSAGGAEWNWSPGIIGHSAFSEANTYLAKVISISMTFTVTVVQIWNLEMCDPHFQ